MSYTTADCKKVLDDWLDSGEVRGEFEPGLWKRVSKSKDSQGRNVREFSNDTDDSPVYVTETDEGLVVSMSQLDAVWLYEICEHDLPFGGHSVAIVSAEFWAENGCLDDDHISDQLESILPEDFSELSESEFEFSCSIKTARSLLNKAGFVETELFNRTNSPRMN